MKNRELGTHNLTGNTSNTIYLTIYLVHLPKSTNHLGCTYEKSPHYMSIVHGIKV